MPTSDELLEAMIDEFLFGLKHKRVERLIATIFI